MSSELLNFPNKSIMPEFNTKDKQCIQLYRDLVKNKATLTNCQIYSCVMDQNYAMLFI